MKQKKYTLEEWEKIGDKYINYCNTNFIEIEELTKTGQIVVLKRQVPATKKGFCVFAGISYQTLMNYLKPNKFIELENIEAYFETTEKIMLQIDARMLERGLLKIYSPALVSKIQDIGNSALEGDETDDSEITIKIKRGTKFDDFE
jgi:hypothetical protein